MKPFQARLGGDGECFCFEVDGDTFKMVMGEKEYNDEIGCFSELVQGGENESKIPETFRIYPDRLFQFLGKSTVTITIEEIEIGTLKRNEITIS